MSATNSLHYELCLAAAKWLRHSLSVRLKERPRACSNRSCHEDRESDYHKRFCNGCSNRYKYIAVELNVTAAENPDVWGYDGYTTVVIEVKTSRADFLSDRKKYWRTVEPEFRAGNLRWYLCPEGLIKSEELPDGWGLLYWDGKKIRPITAPTLQLATGHADMRILYSILRREGFPEKIRITGGTDYNQTVE